MSDKPQDYLVANLHVEKVSYRDLPVDRSSGYAAAAKKFERVKGEVARLVVRAVDIEDLRKKIAGHMDLIDDDVVGEDSSKVMRGE